MKITKEQIYRLQKKMSKNELFRYYNEVKKSGQVFRDKTKYYRPDKKKESRGD